MYNIDGYQNNNPYLSDAQSLLNKFFGATPGQPLKLPIEIPPIALEQETLKEMAEMVYIGTGIIAVGIVGGALIKAWIQQR